MSLSRREFLVRSTATIISLYVVGSVLQRTLKIGVPSLLWNSLIDVKNLKQSLANLKADLHDFEYSKIEIHKTENVYQAGFDLYFTSLSLPSVKISRDPIFYTVGAGPVFQSIESKEQFLQEPWVQEKLKDIYGLVGYVPEYLCSVRTENHCLRSKHLVAQPTLPVSPVKFFWGQYWKDKGKEVLPLPTTQLPKAIRRHQVGLTDYFSSEYADHLLSFNPNDYEKVKLDFESIHSFVTLSGVNSDIRKKENQQLFKSLKLIFAQSVISGSHSSLPATPGIFAANDILEYREAYQMGVFKKFYDNGAETEKLAGLLEMYSGQKLQSRI